jgi:hypothetical protein
VLKALKDDGEQKEVKLRGGNCCEVIRAPTTASVSSSVLYGTNNASENWLQTAQAVP